MRRHCVKSEGNIIDVVEEPITTATYDEISAPTITKNKKGEEVLKYHYTLNAKQYKNVELVCSDKYELVPLSNKCEFLPKIKRLASYTNDNGVFRYYSSGKKILKCDTADINKLSVIIGHSGDGCIFIDNEYSTLMTNHIIYNKEKYIMLYLYHIIKLNWNRFYFDCYIGSTVKNTSDASISKFQIPYPRSTALLNKWVEKISTPYDAIQHKKRKLAALEEKVKLEVQRISDEEKCDMKTLRELCEYIKTGKNKTPDNKKGTKYPYYGTASITGYTNHYLFDGEHLLIARNGTMGNIFYTNSRIYPSDHIFAIKNKDEYHIKYMFYQILSMADIIDKTANGSTIKGINIADLELIKIPIPRNTLLINNLEKDFKKIEILQQEIKDSETEYKQVLQELSDDIKLETIAKDTPKEKNNTNCDTETNDHATSDEPTTKKKIKKVVKKERNSDDEQETKHSVSDEPTIKKKSKKVVKKEHNSDDEQETQHIVSDEPSIKKKSKRVVKKEHIVSDIPRIKKKSKKVVKKEYISDNDD